MFFDDAVVAARELEITLTARNKEKGQSVPMCGVPYHAADGYIAKLIRKGYKVAVCDQVERPRPSQKLVRREVTRVETSPTHQLQPVVRTQLYPKPGDAVDLERPVLFQVAERPRIHCVLIPLRCEVVDSNRAKKLKRRLQLGI